MPPQRSHRADMIRRSKARTKQADRVQVLNPLAIGDVALSAWNAFQVMSVDQIHRESALLKNLKEWNQVDAGLVHRSGSCAAALKPLCQRVEIPSKRIEFAR